MKSIFFTLFFICSVHGSRKPNVVIFYIEHIKDILADVLSPTLGEDLKNLNTLRKESIRFHNIYGEASSPSTFAALFTGRPAVDVGIIRGKLLPFSNFPSLASSGGLSTSERTIAKELQAQGYSTWFSGYWKMGLGSKGDNFPIKHGFDCWSGVAYPHNEWCEQDKSVITNQESLINHPYLKLFYRTSFLWLLLFLFMTMLSWCRFISFELYMNLIVYTVSTGLAFYILLHLFIIQRSASCVLYRQDQVVQQPYDTSNITLQFTQHSAKLLELRRDETPFFMVLNYLKMMPPYKHSSYFDEGRSRSRRNALLELDWSIGFILNKLKDYDIYKDTVVIVTGGSTCSHSNGEPRIAYKKTSTGFIEETTILNWDSCFKIPLWIKDESRKIVSSHSLNDVYDYFPITNIFHTILHVTGNEPNQKSLFRALYGHSTCPIGQFFEVDEYLTLSTEGSNVTIRSRDFTKDDRHDKDKNFLAHYFNIQRPVMITYKQQYQAIFYHLDAYKSLVKLNEASIIDLKNSLLHYKDEKERNKRLETIYKEISNHLKEHMQQRQNLNLWSSQFEMPVLPWLLPCENFPYCRTNHYHDEDFPYLFPKTL